MQRYRFDEKDILIKAITMLLDEGIDRDDIGLVLSRIGPVDIDLMETCLMEICGCDSGHDAHAPLAA